MADPRAAVAFSKEQLDQILPDLRAYLLDHFELDITGLEARLFLQFITERLGDYYYNRGVEDAIAAMTERLDDVYALIRLHD